MQSHPPAPTTTHLNAALEYLACRFGMLDLGDILGILCMTQLLQGESITVQSAGTQVLASCDGSCACTCVQFLDVGASGCCVSSVRSLWQFQTSGSSLFTVVPEVVQH